LKANPESLREVKRDVEEMGAKVIHQCARGSTKVQTVTALTIDEFLAALG